MARTIGNNSASPRFSLPPPPWASHELSVENMAPAMAVPASDEAENFFDEELVGNFVALEIKIIYQLGFWEMVVIMGLLMMHLASSMACWLPVV